MKTTRTFRWALVAAVFGGLPFGADRALAADAPGKQFVQQYVWDIGTFEELRRKEAKEKLSDANQAFASCIRLGTRLQLELDSAAIRMKEFRLAGALKDTPKLIATVYEDRSALYRRLTDTCTEFAAGPKPGKDYGAIAASTPKINAELDYNAKTLFQGSAIIAMALVDQKPDANGKLSRLVITKQERADLIKSINSSFGKSLDAKEPTYLTGSVKLLRDFLMTSRHKCADEK